MKCIHEVAFFYIYTCVDWKLDLKIASPILLLIISINPIQIDHHPFNQLFYM